jgi:hypothetical protein
MYKVTYLNSGSRSLELGNETLNSIEAGGIS